jgi:hypothetical protein
MNETEIEINEPTVHPEGWVQIPVMRGLFEITPLLDLCDKLGGKIIWGYARYCCSRQERLVTAGDVDIFPTGDSSEQCQAVYDAWVNMLKSEGMEIKHENNVSITWDIKENQKFVSCPTIQIIKPIEEGAILTSGTVEEILSNFDFTIVRVALNSDRKTATAWASFEADEKAKRLRILNIHCPISSLLRVMKYGRKGYYMRPIEAIKLFADWEGRTQEYRSRMNDLFSHGEMGKLSKQEIDELEALLRVD